MRIDPNAPAYPAIHSIDGNWVKEPLAEYRGMPIRLAIASQIMAGIGLGGWPEQVAKDCLERADELISAYNRTQP